MREASGGDAAQVSQAEAERGRRWFGRHQLWGSLARELTLLAEDADVDVVVVGSTDEGAPWPRPPRSVGEKLLNGVPCAVAGALVGFAETHHSAAARSGSVIPVPGVEGGPRAGLSHWPAGSAPGRD